VPTVLINTDDVTVLGPPETVEVLLNIGPQGIRGNKIFVGSGDPNTLTINGEIFAQTLELNDVYINAAPGTNYSYMWQYIAGPSSNSWVQILKINPTIYSANYEVEFIAGTGSNIGESSVIIPISNIVTVSGTPLTAENFNIQYAITNANGYPVSSSMIIPPLSGDDLIINLSASEYTGSAWQALEGEITVHVFITVIAS